MKTIVSNILSGIRTGSLVYLLVLLFNVQKSPVSKSNIVSIFIMSACIGVISLIFESERFSFLKLLIIHFWVTLGLVSAMMIYNGWADILALPRFWIDFILIYIIIWGGVRLDIYLKTQKINQVLSERHKKQE
ncbi:DUF3021 domain-containing protein [Streptococcus mutans]|jgi:Protein of unknown function (DUF3021).|uniref:DUF3021 domain-containing protein n=1 Tax=Streptococcus mutans TaxID=1309 RepID=UPI0002B59020|nr:DUF3021 domain-containing protein [Streptococcus mutans]AVM72045.1 DUF3021 domain-containing protein [Streptococcus mutans]EMB68950.1 hypothetical protein SMU33_08688 [Streptococcus mutans 11SSST2]EMB89072.1 hypothetical protein SMU56_00315 [Streptococcus mutans N29]EMB95678.1 hypothetical protein SMU61_03940 [Streptococcus mutans G123]EMC02880.1 hypothetical protein SMU68_05688 [Streptococcus mutans NFSM1]